LKKTEDKPLNSSVYCHLLIFPMSLRNPLRCFEHPNNAPFWQQLATAGAPRFNVIIAEDPNAIYFLGCNAPPPDTDTAGNGWQRLRWGTVMPLMAYKNNVLTNISGKTAKSIEIVFDEGDDTGPDNFGLAVLDNIEVNKTLVKKAGGE
jgi:hypothetical protein